MADRADWDQATHRQRQLAVAADAELRRHLGQPHPPLRSAEPEPATEAQPDELSLTMGKQISDMGERIRELAGRRSEFADRLAERQSMMIPTEGSTECAEAPERHSARISVGGMHIQCPARAHLGDGMSLRRL